MMTAVILLSACSFFDLKTSLERDMAGKDLTFRISVLEKACKAHASDHHGRLEDNADSSNPRYKLSIICNSMGTKISEASSATQLQPIKKAFSGLVSQCYEEGKRVQYYKHQAGVKTRPGTPSWPFYNLDNERGLTRDTETICSLFQREFDQVIARK